MTAVGFFKFHGVVLHVTTASGVCGLHRRPSQLAGYQEKTFAIDDHVGISISGLTADARYLCKYVNRVWWENGNSGWCVAPPGSVVALRLTPPAVTMCPRLMCCRFMRNECVEHKYVYDSPLQTLTLVEDVARSESSPCPGLLPTASVCTVS